MIDIPLDFLENYESILKTRKGPDSLHKYNDSQKIHRKPDDK